MFVRTNTTLFAVCTASLFMLVVTGCGVDLGPGGAEGSLPTLALSTLGLDSDTTHFEFGPNHRFALAESVPIDGEARVIRGTIDSPDDIDVYDLGAAPAGTRVLVTMTAADSLDPALAAFDDVQTALLVNDHRNVYLGRVEPFLDFVTLHASGSIYVAVSSTPGFASSGEYALVASMEFPVTQPPARPDVVLLVFHGGTDVTVGNRTPVDVPPFDASTVSPAFTGLTDVLVAQIVARVRADFDAYDVEVLSTSEGTAFDRPMTRIYFGTFDEALLGVAEGVDEFNATVSQQAVVFTDTFAAFMLLDPSVEEMAQAIANVASHEIGHLLGLVHTADPLGVMDVTATLDQLLYDQAFGTSPIFGAVFALGFQDAARYLLDTVGGDPNSVTASIQAQGTAVRKQIPGGLPPARDSWRFSSSCNSHLARTSKKNWVDRTASSALGLGQLSPGEPK